MIRHRVVVWAKKAVGLWQPLSHNHVGNHEQMCTPAQSRQIGSLLATKQQHGRQLPKENQ